VGGVTTPPPNPAQIKTTSTYSREEIMSDSFNQLYAIILKIIINTNFEIIIYIKMCITIFEQSDECIDFTVIYFYFFFIYICVNVVYTIKF